MVNILQPQEIEVWYVLPAIRRELAVALTEKLKLNQKQVAKILNVSEPAISQYKKSKRAKDVTFKKKTIMEIQKSASRISENPNRLLEEMQRLSRIIKENETLCRIHRMKNPDISNKCCVCIK